MICKNKNGIAALLGAALLFAGTNSQAHTIAIGSLNAGAPGSVTIWMGSYHTGAPNEGALTLNGVTKAFDLLSNVLPAGLVAGSNYFYVDIISGATGDFDAPANLTGATETQWQGVTFTGLTSGDYSYSISGMLSINWADWNSGEANWTSRVNIPDSSVGTVPEPIGAALFGIGALALAAGRRRKS
jgi:hypothetical protein